MTINVINREFSTTIQGRRLLLFDGYIYTLNKDRGKVKYWRRRNRSCTALAHADGNDNYKAHSGSHDGRLPSPAQIQLLKFERQLRKRIIKEKILIAHIYEEELANINLSQISLALTPDAKDVRKDYISFKCFYLLLF